MYAITGATGNIGSKIADTLLARGEKVRVIGRNAARLQRFVDKGAEASVGDLKDGAFVARAFAGATAVFAMIPPEFSARDFRAYQNEVGGNLAAAIKTSGVRNVVNLSSQGADLSEGTGPILGLRDQEARLNGLSGVNVLHLRPTFFMENLLMDIPLINQKGIIGSAVRGDQEFAMIATRDIAAHAAERLVKRDFSGSTVQDLLGERDLSFNEATAVIGREIGMPGLKYVQFPYEDAANWLMEMGVGKDLSRLFIEMNKALNDGLFAVNRPRTRDTTTPTSIEEFAAVTFSRLFAAAAPRKAA
ncbi:MAG TPA: NmrA family NAD(P)-binding protein [Geobacteraceae bacterium]